MKFMIVPIEANPEGIPVPPDAVTGPFETREAAQKAAARVCKGPNHLFKGWAIVPLQAPPPATSGLYDLETGEPFVCGACGGIGGWWCAACS